VFTIITSGDISPSQYNDFTHISLRDTSFNYILTTYKKTISVYEYNKAVEFITSHIQSS